MWLEYKCLQLLLTTFRLSPMAVATLHTVQVSSLDIMATITALAEVPAAVGKPLDGVNLLPYLDGSMPDDGEPEHVPHQYVSIL
jgi:hypothetical protein